ncbi:MAG: zinc-ribbon domain-containing protein [Muribaculum sp.]|nr:zinc-ribbon domain-containing protein [Muribaculum sp.]
MMKCPNCNKELEDGSRFCDECGTPIPETAVQEAATEQAATGEAPEAAQAVVTDKAPEAAQTTEASGNTEKSGNAETQEKAAETAEPVKAAAPETAPQTAAPQTAAPQAAQTVFCPNCGKPLPAGSVFCDNCGTNMAAASNAQIPAPNGEAGQPKKKKSLAPILGIAAACVVVVVLAAAGLFAVSQTGGGSSRNYAMYIKEKELFYSDLKQKNPSQITERLVDAADLSNSSLLYAGSSLAAFITISDDGKTLFFPDKINQSDNGFTLYYSKIAKLGDTAVKIDSDMYLYQVSDKADYVIYLKDGDSLYCYDVKKADKEKIAGNVEGFAVSGDGKQVYYINDEGTFYLWTKGKDKEKIESDIYEVNYVSDDFKTVYYIKGDNLYKKEMKKEREKIASDVSRVLKVYESGSVYYLKDSEEELSMDLFVSDDMKEEDLNLEEPQYPSYFSYDSRSEYDKAVEEYQEAANRYDAKRSRDYMRERMEEYTPYVDISILCYYDGKKETELSDGYISRQQIAADAETMIFSMFNEEAVDKVKLSSAVENSMSCDEIVSDAVQSATLYSLAQKDTVTEFEIEDAHSFRIDSEGKKILYISEYDSDKNNGSLYRMTVNNRGLSDAELIEEDVYGGRFGFAGDLCVYYTDVKDKKGDLCVDGKVVAYDAYVGGDPLVISGESFVVDDAGAYYYVTDYNSDKQQGTLSYYANGKSVKVADDVFAYSLVGNKKAVVLGNYSMSKYRGELYLYTNNKLKTMDDDVVCILSPDSNVMGMSIYQYTGSRE